MMKTPSFHKLSLFAFTAAWTVMNMVFLSLEWLDDGVFKAKSLAFMGVFTGIFSIAFYLLFILPPSNGFKKRLGEVSLIKATLFGGFWAVLGFFLLIGWAFLSHGAFILFVFPLIAGLTYGFLLKFLWDRRYSLSPVINDWFAFLLIPSAYYVVFGYVIPYIYSMIG